MRGGITTASIDMVSRQDVIYKICDFCSGLMKRQGRQPSAIQIRDALTSMVRALPAATGAATLQPIQRPGQNLDSLPLETRETADRIITREAFLRGGRVGTEVFRCGVCRTQVYGRDRFCRGCGRELLKTDRKVDTDEGVTR